MASYKVLFVLVALTVVGHVQSRSTSDVSVITPTGNDLDPSCPHSVTNTTTILQTLMDKQDMCYTPSLATKLRLGAAASTDEYRLIIQGACAKIPSVKSCMDEVASEAALCLNKMEAKLVESDYENTMVAMSATCDDNSDAMALVLGVEIRALSKESRTDITKCLTAFVKDPKFNAEEETVTGFTMRKYQTLKGARKCILDIAHRDGATMSQFEKLCDKLIGGFMCVSPLTRELVVCAALLQSATAIEVVETH